MQAVQVLPVVAQALQCDIDAREEQASHEFELNIYPAIQVRHVVAVVDVQVSHPVEQAKQLFADVR